MSVSDERLAELLDGDEYDAEITMAEIMVMARELQALRERAGKLPKEPPLGLLVSMALRDDHGLFLPPDQFAPHRGPAYIEGSIRTMRQLYEEVSGHGFWSPENNCEYEASYQSAIGPLPGEG